MLIISVILVYVIFIKVLNTIIYYIEYIFIACLAFFKFHVGIIL